MNDKTGCFCDSLMIIFHDFFAYVGVTCLFDAYWNGKVFKFRFFWSLKWGEKLSALKKLKDLKLIEKS